MNIPIFEVKVFFNGKEYVIIDELSGKAYVKETLAMVETSVGFMIGQANDEVKKLNPRFP